MRFCRDCGAAETDVINHYYACPSNENSAGYRDAADEIADLRKQLEEAQYQQKGRDRVWEIRVHQLEERIRQDQEWPRVIQVLQHDKPVPIHFKGELGTCRVLQVVAVHRAADGLTITVGPSK
jgi:hypothetical protein